MLFRSEQKQSFLERLTGTKKITEEDAPMVTENLSSERTMHHSIEQTFEEPMNETAEEEGSYDTHRYFFISIYKTFFSGSVNSSSFSTDKKCLRKATVAAFKLAIS